MSIQNAKLDQVIDRFDQIEARLGSICVRQIPARGFQLARLLRDGLQFGVFF